MYKNIHKHIYTHTYTYIITYITNMLKGNKRYKNIFPGETKLRMV